MLPKLLVGLGRKDARGPIPDELIDTDHARRAVFAAVRRVDVRVPQLNEEGVAAVHAGRIDVAVERNCHAWLQAEAIKHINECDVLAVRHVQFAVRQRKLDAESSLLRIIRHRECIAREDPHLRSVKAEQDVDLALVLEWRSDGDSLGLVHAA